MSESAPCLPDDNPQYNGRGERTMAVWIRHIFPEDPASVPLRLIENDAALVVDAGGNPDDFGFQCWELATEWLGHARGSKVVTGVVRPGFYFKVREE
jgi:hypothetical protein